MWRSIFFLILGIFGTALFFDAISVYIFHDVDADLIGRSNEAFLGITGESILFTILVGGTAAILTLLGRRLFQLKDYSPGNIRSFLLGFGVIAVQYL